MKGWFLLGLFLSFPVHIYSQANASEWSVVEYSNDKGSNALTTVYVGSVSPPIWATLIIDFGVSRRCSPGIGFMIKNNRDLGQPVSQKYNPSLSLRVHIKDRAWDLGADVMVNYSNGLEILAKISEQSLLDSLMADKGTSIISIYSFEENNFPTKFGLKGGSKIIRTAFNRCNARIN